MVLLYPQKRSADLHSKTDLVTVTDINSYHAHTLAQKGTSKEQDRSTTFKKHHHQVKAPH